MPERRTTRSGQTAQRSGLEGKAVQAKLRGSAGVDRLAAARQPSHGGGSDQLPGAAPTPASPGQAPAGPRVVQPDEPWQTLLLSHRERGRAAARRAAQQAQREAMSAAVARGSLSSQTPRLSPTVAQARILLLALSTYAA